MKVGRAQQHAAAGWRAGLRLARGHIVLAPADPGRPAGRRQSPNQRVSSQPASHPSGAHNPFRLRQSSERGKKQPRIENWF